ncbi:MAG: hypothetical protein CMO80_22015 [Verrucomicrobiales bacterium]|nr:hypothetical protein [Verrucomicrobiales bacterium]
MNTQKPLRLQKNHPSEVLLHSIFPTIQGEGIYAGHPATFIRLAGCNLKCPVCDTEYTKGARMRSVDHIVKAVEHVTAPNKLVVITGGEPFRQDLSELVAQLMKYEYTVQIETNGTLPPTYNTNYPVRIMCSPKIGRIHKELAPHVSAYKYVVDYKHVDIVDGLPTRVLGLKVKPARPPIEHERPIFIQPVDCKNPKENEKHLLAAVSSAMAHGYTLCLQIHKIIDVE